MKSAKLASLLCKIYLSKHHWAFVKVVEGSEIYNFGINSLMHFSYKISRKTWSNEAALKRFHAGTRARAVDIARRSTTAAAASSYTHVETCRWPSVHELRLSSCSRCRGALVGATCRARTGRVAPPTCRHWPLPRARRLRLVPCRAHAASWPDDMTREPPL
jgi:hypothetical protein